MRCVQQRLRPVISIQSPVLHCFGQVFGRDANKGVQVRDGARDLQDAVVQRTADLAQVSLDDRARAAGIRGSGRRRIRGGTPVQLSTATEYQPECRGFIRTIRGVFSDRLLAQREQLLVHALLAATGAIARIRAGLIFRR